jgi:hypothetical protein
MHRNFRCSGFLGPLWEWKRRQIPTAEVRKILSVVKRRERLHGGEFQGSRWSVGHGRDWVFIVFFCIARGQRCLSGADRCFLGRRGVSLRTYHLLGPPAVLPSMLCFMILLTVYRSLFLSVFSCVPVLLFQQVLHLSLCMIMFVFGYVFIFWICLPYMRGNHVTFVFLKLHLTWCPLIASIYL